MPQGHKNISASQAKPTSAAAASSHSPTPRRRPVLLTFVLLFLLLFSGFLLLQAEIKRIGGAAFYTKSSVPPAYSALVLGAKANADGSPSLMLKERLDVAVDLYKSDKVKNILASGDHGSKEYDEVNTMKKYLLAQGIPPEAIFLDHAGFNTYDSLYRARDVFAASSIIICTQRYHAYRAVYIGQSLGMDVRACPAEDLPVYHMFYNNLRESLARLKAFIETQITRRLPKYLGEVIPITKTKGQDSWD